MAPESSHTSAGSATTEPDIKEHAESDILKIGSSLDAGGDWAYTAVELEGDYLQEQPLWLDSTHIDQDLRPLRPLTLRFTAQAKSEGQICPSRVQTTIRDAIWDKVHRILPKVSTAHTLPDIVFHSDPHDEDPGVEYIDLIFECPNVLQGVMKGIAEIQIESFRGNAAGDFTQLCATGSLAGDIMQFDIEGLPVDTTDFSAVVEGLTSIASDIGSVTGIAKIMAYSKKWDKETYTGIIRGSIELNREGMLLPFVDLARSLPTHIDVGGVAYTLVYPGRGLHEEHKVAHVSQVLVKQDKQGATKKKRPRTSAKGESSSSTAAKKKSRKTK
ncbi:hypothetical protein BDZ90DRAFT_228706 [Jaminaea rosea]|uniref:Uncharacterized protein n=1 Tax=Jaminaea rosea TaxID=1569628 RepID=A0A316UHQ6_9BASI|nr:hypothetical protein BDZ90DRAFT_228706 [Jaminaea rosea]PWN24739.1 hypothetical protein BDZ90DRAFT_228706 [Jaminaea rosea]